MSFIITHWPTYHRTLLIHVLLPSLNHLLSDIPVPSSLITPLCLHFICKIYIISLCLDVTCNIWNYIFYMTEKSSFFFCVWLISLIIMIYYLTFLIMNIFYSSDERNTYICVYIYICICVCVPHFLYTFIYW